MKHQIRILGIDDAPFTFQDTSTAIIGVVMRGGEYIECVLKNQISIDGDDATQICSAMINNTKHKKQLKVIMLDGVTLGGFNVIDTQTLYEETRLPILTITRDKPDFQTIKHALQKNFDDWKRRWSLINKGPLHEIQTHHNPIYIKQVGVSLEEAKELIKLSTIRGVLPEPIRVAHLIASGITRGESYGKA